MSIVCDKNTKLYSNAHLPLLHKWLRAKLKITCLCESVPVQHMCTTFTYTSVWIYLFVFVF